MTCTEEEKKIYSLQDVQKHDSNKSLWLVIHNRVYDITKFLDEVRKCLNVILFRTLLEDICRQIW